MLGEIICVLQYAAGRHDINFRINLTDNHAVCLNVSFIRQAVVYIFIYVTSIIENILRPAICLNNAFKHKQML